MTPQAQAEGPLGLTVGQGMTEAAGVLARLGLRVTAAADVAAALPRLGDAAVVLVSDERSIGPIATEAPGIPLVMVGARAAAVSPLLAAGATEVLCGPLEPALLEARVGALLRLTRNVRAAAEARPRDGDQAARLKDQFLATLSHEMRTPLTAILGWVSLLRLGKASADPGGRALETIERNARLQARLVGDLLDVQRMASGKMTLNFRDTELGALLDAAVHGAEPACAEAGVEVLITRPLDEELHVFGDPERLHQAVSSLLSNAVKFSARGMKVRVVLQPVGNEASIIVHDEGRGIDTAFLERLFEPFSLQEGDLAREKRGMGIGLALVHHVVEMHGGTVSAESEGAGKGARFLVSLPLTARVAKPAARPPPPPSRPPVRADLQGLRILVVEDDVDTQQMLVTLLEQLGARVTAAGSAAEAFSTLQGRQFDVLLSDISMPGEDGYSLIRRVRAGAAQPSIPAAALTANAAPADRARALAAGFHEHIAKPVEPLELAQILARLARSAS